MDKITILGHKNPDVDAVISGILMKKLLNYYNYDAEFVIPDPYLDFETYELLKKYNIDMKKYRRNLTQNDNLFFLVDHTNNNFAPNVIGIIDHHNEILKKTPEYYINKNASSTAMIIYDLNPDIFDKNDLELIVLANMVDTASFNSSKTRKIDIAKTLEIIKDNNLDYEKIYKDGLCLTPLNNLRDAAFTGYKKLNYKNKIIASSYVQVYGKDFDTIKIMTNIVKDELWLDKIDIYIFIVYDMQCLSTTVHFMSKKNVQKYKYNEYKSRKDAINGILERIKL
ncbi:MAG: DHH family phosphoesterase [Bacilli bacterium]|nr:DHH family phosphoesterase [Bacilli bacterium]